MKDDEIKRLSNVSPAELERFKQLDIATNRRSSTRWLSHYAIDGLRQEIGPSPRRESRRIGM